MKATTDVPRHGHMITMMTDFLTRGEHVLSLWMTWTTWTEEIGTAILLTAEAEEDITRMRTTAAEAMAEAETAVPLTLVMIIMEVKGAGAETTFGTTTAPARNRSMMIDSWKTP